MSVCGIVNHQRSLSVQKRFKFRKHDALSPAGEERRLRGASQRLPGADHGLQISHRCHLVCRQMIPSAPFREHDIQQARQQQHVWRIALAFARLGILRRQQPAGFANTRRSGLAPDLSPNRGSRQLPLRASALAEPRRREFHPAEPTAAVGSAWPRCCPAKRRVPSPLRVRGGYNRQGP